MENSKEHKNKAFKLTPGQQRAVDVRDSNVLVAAAAGSGKTKVLVDRILGKVTDPEHPVNVDEFLVVTFTNAAAAQMREKIREKLKEALEKSPESQHLSLQQLLVNRANICTIDSFCLKLVKENFNMLDIDSNFTIADPGMMDLVKSDVINELFERLYDENDNDFRLLVDIFDHKNQEEELKVAVNKIYDKASSYPVPELWLEQAKKSLMVEDEDDLNKLPWIKAYMNIIRSELKSLKDNVNEFVNICTLPGGPDRYLAAAEKDMDYLEQLMASDTYSQLSGVGQTKWASLKSCSGDAYDKSLIDEAQKIRKGYKDSVNKLVPNIDTKSLIQEIKDIAIYLIPLIELTEKFMDALMQEKKARRLFGFSDIEHMAHRLVCKGYNDGKPEPTDFAKNIADGIAEIYIDEYQDSNYLQEDILTCVSGNYKGNHNMFMVGDVKQSIYRFRMARPELFIEKYNSFTNEGENIKILLNNNFRSRAEVLLPINYFFYQLMGEDFGGIAYDESVSLVPSMDFPEPQEDKLPISQNTEIMILNLEKEEDELTSDAFGNEPGIVDAEVDEELENMKNLELEAHMIAARIKKLVDDTHGMRIYDEKTKCYRKASYSDIVILTRSMAGVGEQLYSVLSAHGIPVYVSDPKGYFDATEIKVVMSLLSVIDNTKQDIPLASVVMSPVVGLSESELAIICNYSKDKKVSYLYDKCQLYMLDKDDAIKDKLESFFCILDKLKAMKNRVSISQLIWEALNMTGYYTYVSAMPMGHRRKANLDMLLEKADSYEDGYYKGLFNFLKYIEKLKVNQVDFGEAAVVSDDENVVKIMTMHASKGLEYPIVFVSALGKWFSKNDFNTNLIVNSDYYLAMKYMNSDKRYIKDTFIRHCFKEINKADGIAEELRVLYVALTRAKEKLIITGHTKAYSRLMEKFKALDSNSDILLPYMIRKKSQSFIELIMATMVRFETLKEKYQVGDILTMEVVTRKRLYEELVNKTADELSDVAGLVAEMDDSVDAVMLQQIRESFGYEYPYQLLTQLRSKMSVSDIKKKKAFNGVGYDESEFEQKALEKEAFLDKDETEEMTCEIQDKTSSSKLTGAMRGTIVHKCMELVDFGSLKEEKNLYMFAKEHKKSLKENGVFNETELMAINCKKIANMLKSDLGQRMIEAATRGELFKEQQFSIGFSVDDIYDIEELNKLDDIVIVQGIVDGYFVEDGEIVVMDYKTDACDEETLIGRYKAQLDYYAQTISKLRGMPVKEKVMYSFGMEKVVPL